MAPAKEVEHKPAKVDKWDTSATKNALDDAVKKVLNDTFGCEEDHSLMNGRLVISAIGVGFASFACGWDYYRPFPESRPVLITCALSYFFMMGILTLYVMLKEKGIFFVALEKDKAGIDPPNVWTFSSQQKRFDDVYELQVEYRDCKGFKKEDSLKESVTKFYDEKGTLREDLFHPRIKDLCTRLKTGKKTN